MILRELNEVPENVLFVDTEDCPEEDWPDSLLESSSSPASASSSGSAREPDGGCEDCGKDNPSAEDNNKDDYYPTICM